MPIEYICTVCGKKFTQGQGIIITRNNISLYFHSKTCLARFSLRLLNEAPDIGCIIKTIEELVLEYRKLREKEKQI